MSEDANETIEAEAFPIDEETGEIDYEKVNHDKEAKEKLKKSLDEAKELISRIPDMTVTDVIAFSLACGITFTVAAYIFMALIAVIALVFTSFYTLVSILVLGTAIPLCAIVAVKLFYKLKKDKNS